MKSMSFLKKKSMLLIIAIGLILTAILIAIPTGYEDALIYQGMERAVGEIVAVDNSAIKSSGGDPVRRTVLYPPYSGWDI